MTIYTIGYQKLQPADLVRICDSLRIDVVYDVRSVPSSRKKGWSRRALETLLGTRYQWRGYDLGGRGDGPSHDEVVALHDDERNVLLMCMEDAPGECHRHHAISMTLLNECDVDCLHICGDEVVPASELDRALRDRASGGSGSYSCYSLSEVSESALAEPVSVGTP